MRKHIDPCMVNVTAVHCKCSLHKAVVTSLDYLSRRLTTFIPTWIHRSVIFPSGYTGIFEATFEWARLRKRVGGLFDITGMKQTLGIAAATNNGCLSSEARGILWYCYSSPRLRAWHLLPLWFQPEHFQSCSSPSPLTTTKFSKFWIFITHLR